MNTATTTTGDNYSLIIVQTAIMEQEVIADPDAMASGINTTGRVAIYGIYFDHVFRQNEPIHITSQILGHKLVKVGDGYKVRIQVPVMK